MTQKNRKGQKIVETIVYETRSSSSDRELTGNNFGVIVIGVVIGACALAAIAK